MAGWKRTLLVPRVRSGHQARRHGGASWSGFIKSRRSVAARWRHRGARRGDEHAPHPARRAP